MHENNTQPVSEIDRRQFFSWAHSGLGGAAIASLLMQDDIAQAAFSTGKTSNPAPHHTPKAKRVVHICLLGGLSHLDSFDYKPELARQHGKSLTTSEQPDSFSGKVGLIRKNDWDFKQRGESGLWVSELFPHLAKVADELTVIRSMVAESSSHTPATFQQNTGFRLNGYPVLGSWLSYGLGCETEELPTYVVLPDVRGFPAGGSPNWTNGFLPTQHQGVAFQTEGDPIPHLFPARNIDAATETASRRLLAEMNQSHLVQYGDEVLAARIRSYEMAARMQLTVPGVVDLDRESAATHKLYGLNDETTAPFGRSCLLARRLLEKGVRFVQLFSGGAFGSPRINWDGHEDMPTNHGREAPLIDQPVAALVEDLRQRGMLDDTLVLFTTEFGRAPFTQTDDNTVGKGRDHNQTGFSVWLAGAGLKAGFAYGATDSVGYKVVENPAHWNDFHATVLHLLGIDHERLTHYHNGIQRRLTNVSGHVIHDILA